METTFDDESAGFKRITDDELRAEARRRGYELHSVQFSQAARALRELEGLRRRIDELAGALQAEP